MIFTKKHSPKNKALIIAVIIAVCAAIPSYAQKNDSLSGKENKAITELVSINSSLKSYQGKLNSNKNEMASVKARSLKIKSEIADAKKNLKAKKKVFALRIRSLYKADGASFIEVILKSRSINELLTGFDFMQKIANRDKSVIEDIKKQENALYSLEKNLDSRYIEIAVLSKNNKLAIGKLRSRASAKKVLIADLKSRKMKVGKVQGRAAQAESKLASLGPSKAPNGQKIRVWATAYGANDPASGTYGWTSTGLRAAHGIAAVSASPGSRVLPLGTNIYVPGYGKALIADIGGGVASNSIDLCFETVGECNQWGARWVTVTIY